MTTVIGIVVFYALLAGLVRRILKPPDDQEPPQPPDQPLPYTYMQLFDVREMAAAAKIEADAAGELDGLLTMLQTCDRNLTRCIQISWQDNTGDHTETVFCSGGSETRALMHIAYRQQATHRSQLADITQQLAQRSGRHAQNGVQNDDRGLW